MKLRPIIYPFAVPSLIHLISLNLSNEMRPMIIWTTASFALQFQFMLLSGIVPRAECSKNAVPKLCTFFVLIACLLFIFFFKCKECIIMFIHTGAELGFPGQL